MAIYMSYGSIMGGVDVPDFKDQIELTSFSWSIDRTVSTTGSTSKTRECQEPEIHEVRVTKRIDVASNDLFKDSVAGELKSDAVISFTQTTGQGVKMYLKYKLEQCGLTHYSVDSVGDTPTENLTINFLKVSQTFAETSNTIGYDLGQMMTI